MILAGPIMHHHYYEERMFTFPWPGPHAMRGLFFGAVSGFLALMAAEAAWCALRWVDSLIGNREDGKTTGNDSAA